MATHHLDDTQPHAFWDHSLQPRLRIQSGDTVVFETLEASAGQVRPDSSSEALRSLDFSYIHPLTGPVSIEEQSQAMRWKLLSSASNTRVGAGMALYPASACSPMIFQSHTYITTK